MIKVSNLCVAFDKPVLENVNIEFPDDGTYFISAPSGKGKTTFFNALAGLVKYSGEVEITGKISYLFQEDRLLDWYSAEKNIKLTAESTEKADYYIKAFGIDEFLSKKPRKMSGGMKRRCAIARCFAYGGDIFLLDEPFRGLDTDNIKIVAHETEKLNGLKIIITHSEEEAMMLNAKKAHLFNT